MPALPVTRPRTGWLRLQWPPRPLRLEPGPTSGRPTPDRQRQQGGDSSAEQSRAAAEAVRIAIVPEAVEVLPGGDEIGVDVQIFNLSPIVDAFRVTTPTAPDWLVTSAPEVRLLPNSNEHSRLSVRIPGGTSGPGRPVGAC